MKKIPEVCALDRYLEYIDFTQPRDVIQRRRPAGRNPSEEDVTLMYCPAIEYVWGEDMDIAGCVQRDKENREAVVEDWHKWLIKLPEWAHVADHPGE